MNVHLQEVNDSWQVCGILSVNMGSSTVNNTHFGQGQRIQNWSIYLGY